MNKEENFWNWFSKNSSKFLDINLEKNKDIKEELLDILLFKLHEYSDGLYFEIGGTPGVYPQELIITAQGDEEFFAAVEKLVTSAPVINGWEIIAFKPEMGCDFITEYKEIVLDPKKIWFLPLDNKKDFHFLGLRVYMPDFEFSKKQLYLEGVYILLDVILGEKSSVLDVNYVDIDLLSVNPEEHCLIELCSLPDYIKWRKTLLK